PDLATALNNLGSRLSTLDWWEQALAATEEAVQIRRRLAAANPAAFEPDLARGLWGSAWVRAACQVELDQALRNAQQAADIYGRLANQLRAVFTGDRHGALQTMADVLNGLGRQDEADEIRRELKAEE